MTRWTTKYLKKKLPNYNRDKDNRGLLVKLCKKVTAVCETYICYITRTVVTTTTARAADVAEKVRIPICDAYQAITLPGRTADTPVGRTTTRDF